MDNRPGGSGAVATEAVVRAATDRHTLGLGCLPVNATNPILRSDLSFDVDAETGPIALIGTGRMYLLVHPAVAAADLQGLLAHARANPGRLSYGSGGNATPQHPVMESLKIRERLDIGMVPYPRGGLLPDLVAGRIQAAVHVGPMDIVREARRWRDGGDRLKRTGRAHQGPCRPGPDPAERSARHAASSGTPTVDRR